MASGYKMTRWTRRTMRTKTMASGCKRTLLKMCPLRGEPCDNTCAWFREDDGGRCAMWQIADRLTDLENTVTALDSVDIELEEINKSLNDIWRDSGK